VLKGDTTLNVVERYHRGIQNRNMPIYSFLCAIIGRISDYGLHDEKKAAGWKSMRAVQMEIVEADEHTAWVNTDDLNGGDEKNPGGDIHYPKDEYPKLGARLAEKSLELLKKCT